MTAAVPLPGRRRLAQVLLVLIVLGATSGILRVVVQNNILLGRMTTDVATAQRRAFNLSNGEREALLLLQRLTELESGGDPAVATERRSLLSRQLEVSGTGFAPGSAQYREIAAIRAALAAFRWDQLGDPDRGAALTRRAVTLVSGLEVRIKTLYGEQESYFYEATLQSLQAKKANERALAGLVALVAVLGVCWIAVLKRRNRSDLARAYDALVAEAEERRALQDQLSHQAYHDSLTGLPNRALFMRRLTEALRTAEASDGAAAAILVDLDGFKNVNDTLGHPAGDELLQRAAERLRGCILDGDTVARLGGDEFAIAVPGGTPEHAVAISRRVITALRRPISAAGQEVRVGASIGVAPLAGHPSAEDLLADADIAMYEAKRSGKGRFLVFSPDMRERTSRRAQLEQQLSRAVTLGQIEVQYQPIVDLHSRRVIAVEALARWHRDGEVIGPDVFVPIAEEAGLIGEIGAEVLHRAAETVQRWRRTEPGSADLGVTVNVSGWQIVAGDYSLQLADALAVTGLPPEALTLEITESILLDDSDALTGELNRIRALGVRLAMDDFGAGHSSLSSLLRYQVDTLKIDRMFLDRALGSRTSLVHAVAELGRTLGLTVVAEGVETAEQLALVRAAGCDAVQGFLVSRPLPEEDARLFLEWAASSGEMSALLARSEASA